MARLLQAFNSALLSVSALFDKFRRLPLEPFLALKAAKMNCLAFIRDLKLSRVFVQNHAANRVSKHILCSQPQR